MKDYLANLFSLFKEIWNEPYYSFKDLIVFVFRIIIMAVATFLIL